MGIREVMSPSRAVFLDRDGVLNECRVLEGRPYPPEDADALCLARDALASLTRLKAAGFVLVCVTNQPDAARGTRTLQNIQDMNDKVRGALPLDALYVCFHDRGDNCECRKPKPGMLLRGAAEFNLDLVQSFMIGDRASDIGAGKTAGCRTIFLSRNDAEPPPSPPADYSCNTLTEAVNWILAQTSPGDGLSPGRTPW